MVLLVWIPAIKRVRQHVHYVQMPLDIGCTIPLHIIVLRTPYTQEPREKLTPRQQTAKILLEKVLEKVGEHAAEYTTDNYY